jgi:mannitol operon transcriptional antiterminator
MRAQNSPKLTDNGRRLLIRLAELPSMWITAAALGESIGISRRTVMRELPGMEHWLQDAGYRFVRNPGQGVRLLENDARRNALHAQLTQTRAPLSRTARIDRLLSLLFAANQPVKAQWLAHRLDVSEHTLASDLADGDAWLQARGAALRRKPGIGVWLEGNPEILRRALGVRLRPQLAALDWQSFMQTRQKESPLSLLNAQDVQAVIEVLQQFETHNRFVFSDSAFLSLVLHFTLLAGQLRHGTVSASGTGLSAVSPAAELLLSLSDALHLHLPAEEAHYLSYFLHTALGMPDWDDPEALRISRLAMALIHGMEQQTGVPLAGFSTLRTDLCAHLRPMLLRLHHREHLENPQLAEIQEQYPTLWRAVRQVCTETAQMLHLPAIPDGEAGFLAMHFGAVLAECEKLRRLRAVVVCPMGMASSRFLTSQLDRDFPEISVERMCPLRELNPEALRAEGIRLILSTVPLHIDFPHLVIHPVLQEQDRILLQNVVHEFHNEQDAGTAAGSAAAPDLRRTNAFHSGIIDLIDHLRIAPAAFPASYAQLIQDAAHLFDSSHPDRIAQALARREALGSTYIPPFQALLLHCKTDAVSSGRFGYLTLPQPLHLDAGLVWGALVLLAPTEPAAVWNPLMSEVSAVLIDCPLLLDRLRSGDADGAAHLLEEELSRRLPTLLRGG